MVSRTVVCKHENYLFPEEEHLSVNGLKDLAVQCQPHFLVCGLGIYSRLCFTTCSEPITFNSSQFCNYFRNGSLAGQKFISPLVEWPLSTWNQAALNLHHIALRSFAKVPTRRVNWIWLTSLQATLSTSTTHLRFLVWEDITFVDMGLWARWQRSDVYSGGRSFNWKIYLNGY